MESYIALVLYTLPINIVYNNTKLYKYTCCILWFRGDFLNNQIFYKYLFPFLVFTLRF